MPYFVAGNTTLNGSKVRTDLSTKAFPTSVENFMIAAWLGSDTGLEALCSSALDGLVDAAFSPFMSELKSLLGVELLDRLMSGGSLLVGVCGLGQANSSEGSDEYDLVEHGLSLLN